MISKKFPIAFHNGSNCDYHFILIDVAEEFNKKVSCLGENTKKYIAILVSIVESYNN